MENDFDANFTISDSNSKFGKQSPFGPSDYLNKAVNNNDDLEIQSQRSRHNVRTDVKLSDKDFFADFAQQLVLSIDEADQYRGVPELSSSFHHNRLTSQFEPHHSQLVRSQSVLINPINANQVDKFPPKKATLEDVAANQQRLNEIMGLPLEEEDAHSATHLYDSDDSNSQATNSTFLNFQRSHNILVQSDSNNNSNSQLGAIESHLGRSPQLRSIYSRPFQTKPKKTSQFHTSLSSSNEHNTLTQTEVRRQSQFNQAMSQSQVESIQPEPHQLLEYDRLVKLFIKEQTAKQQETWVLPKTNPPSTQPQLNPFNSSTSQRKLTRLACQDYERGVEQPTDESIEEIIEIDQESQGTQKSGIIQPVQRGLFGGKSSAASFTIDSNLCVLGQSPEEEFKFQFAPFQARSTRRNKEVRLSYATDQSQESEDNQSIQIEFPNHKHNGRNSPQPETNIMAFEDLEALFSYNREETLTMPETRQNNHHALQEIDEDPPFYIPRCLTDYVHPDNQPLFEERKSNKADSFASQAESFASVLESKPAKPDDDLVIQKSPTKKLQSSQSNKPKLKFSNFSASSLSDDRWLCPICLDIFQDAVETPCCNNLFCMVCIRQAHTCPLCTQRIVGPLKPNIPIRRLVMELSVTCGNEDCSQVIRRCDMEKHQALCQFEMVDCSNTQFCGKVIRRDYQRHVTEMCSFREVSCLLLCGAKMALNEVDQHIRTACPKSEVPCKNKCGQYVLRGLQEQHCATVCKLEVVHCPNKGESLFEDGCPLTSKRKELESHKQQCSYRRVICANQKCMQLLMFKDLASHDDRCLFKIIECENKCGCRFLRQNFQQHKEQCEFQLVKCPYYELGCKIEVLRKDFKVHLMEESFNHSIIFIQGQQQKNQEIDLLRNEIQSLRKDYDCEVQWMFLELQRVKQDIKDIKQKDTGQKIDIASQISSHQKNILMKEDQRYFNHQSLSGNSGVRFIQEIQPQRPITRQRTGLQQQVVPPSLDSVFNEQYLENLPISATQVASSINNFFNGQRFSNGARQGDGLSQLNPLTSMQKHPRSLAQLMGSQEEYKESIPFFQLDHLRENQRQEQNNLFRPQVGQQTNSAQFQSRRRPTVSKDNNSPRHLDNSNVLYDLDFEIDEDKVNF